MDASNQTQLLLCALRHFDIDIVRQSNQTLWLKGGLEIRFQPDTPFVLLREGRQLGTFSDVVRLCSAVQSQSVVSSS